MEGKAGEEPLVFLGVEDGPEAQNIIGRGGIPRDVSALAETVPLVEGEPFPSLFGVGGLIVQGLDVEHDALARLLGLDLA